MEKVKVININKFNNDSHKQEQARKVCGKIIPGKFTFLNSNQLITKYVKKGNVQQNLLSPANPSKSITAYVSTIKIFQDLCVSETVAHQSLKNEKKIKEKKILNQIGRNNYLNRKQLAQKQKQLDDQAQKIETMVQSIYEKAGDIMCGRNSSTYNRKQSNANTTSLKQLKSSTSEKSFKKIEVTRNTMLNKIVRFQEALHKSASQSINNSLSLQYSTNQSLLSSSINSNDVVRERDQKKGQKQSLLKKLLRAQDFEQVYQAKRRNAALKGFGMFWELGCADKKINTISLFERGKTLHRNNCKNGKKSEYKKSFLEELNEKLNSNLAIKQKYLNAFEERVGEFLLVEKS